MNTELENEEKLRESVAIGDEDSVQEYILHQKVNINSANSINGWTALHWAAKRGHSRICSFLLNQGADRNVKNKQEETPLDVTSDTTIIAMLGGDPKQQKTKAENLPFQPNYLAHPVFPYAKENSKYAVTNGAEPQRNVPAATPLAHQSADNELVLKVRVANAAERDFIEIELSHSDITFHNLVSTMCKELGVSPELVLKIRKLPDTIVRKDKDVKRLRDFQEVELVMSNRMLAQSNSMESKPSVSPRHIDIVY